MKSFLLDAFYTRPDFLIIGAQKCGTTALYHYLSQHPQILPARNKEVHFFDYGYHRGETWYFRRFPTQRQVKTAQKQCGFPVITGEASPSYLLYPEAAPRAHAFVPHAKLLVLLRNPVDRAWSHYQMNRSKGMVFDVRQNCEVSREPLSFEEALAQEEARLQAAQASLQENDARDLGLQLHSYRERGIYARQIKHWLNFFPREQVHFVDSAQLHKDTENSFNRVLDFLQLQPLKLPIYEQKLVGVYKETMSPHIRQQLIEFFQPHNEELYELLGQKFDWDC